MSLGRRSQGRSLGVCLSAWKFLPASHLFIGLPGASFGGSHCSAIPWGEGLLPWALGEELDLGYRQRGIGAQLEWGVQLDSTDWERQAWGVAGVGLRRLGFRASCLPPYTGLKLNPNSLSCTSPQPRAGLLQLTLGPAPSLECLRPRLFGRLPAGAKPGKRGR